METLVEEQKEKQEVLKSSIKLEDAAEQELAEAQAKAAERRPRSRLLHWRRLSAEEAKRAAEAQAAEAAQAQAEARASASAALRPKPMLWKRSAPAQALEEKKAALQSANDDERPPSRPNWPPRRRP